MTDEPVRVTFEFDGDLNEEIEKIAETIKGLRDESSATFQRLAEGERSAAASIAQGQAELASSAHEGVEALHRLSAMLQALDDGYKDGTITLEEYLEARKKVTDMDAEVREGVMDSVNGMIEGAEEMTGLGEGLMSVLQSIPGPIGAIASQNKLVAAATMLWDKAVATLNARLGISIGLSKALVAGGIGLIIAAVAGAVLAYSNWKDAQDDLNKVRAEGLRSAQAEITQITTLDKVLRDANNSYTARREALSRMKEIMPTYNAMLTKEGELIEDNTGSLARYIAMLKAAALAKVYAEKLANAQADYDEWQSNLSKGEKETLIGGRMGDLPLGRGFAYRVLSKQFEELQAPIERYEKELLKYQTEALELQSNLGMGVKGSAKVKAPATEDPMKELRRQADYALKLARQEQEIANESIRHKHEIAQRKLDLEADSFERRMSQNELNYEKELQSIREHEQALLRAIQERERAEWEAGGGEGVFAPTTLVLPEDMQARIDEQMGLAQVAFRRGTDALIREQAELWREEERRFGSHLDNELAEIRRHYQEKIALAKGDTALIQKLEENRNKEIEYAISRNYANIRLDAIDHEEQIALIELEGQKDSIALTSLYELKKVKIVQDANKKRLQELKALHDSAVGDDKVAYLKEINRLTLELEANNLAAEQAARRLFDESISGTKELLNAFKSLNGEMDYSAETFNVFLNAVSQMASGNYIGAVLGFISGAIAMIADSMKEEERLVKIAKEHEAAYYDAVNYKIERQINLLKEVNDLSLDAAERGREIASNAADGLQKELWQKPIKIKFEKDRLSDYLNDAGEEEIEMFNRIFNHGFSKTLLNQSGLKGGVHNYIDALKGLTIDELIGLKEMKSIWQLLPDDIRDYISELESLRQKEEDILSLERELLTGATRDSITDSIVSGFREGKRSAKDFADDFEAMMKEAVLQGLKMKYLQAPLEAWYDAFAEASQDDLTAAEIEELRESYNKIIANAGSYLKGMEDITGLSFEDNAGRSATRRGLESISQDSADLLNGKFSTMLFYMDKIEQRSGHVLDALIPALSHLAEIRDNTRYCRKLEAMERYLSRLATIVDNGIDIRR